MRFAFLAFLASCILAAIAAAAPSQRGHASPSEADRASAETIRRISNVRP